MRILFGQIELSGIAAVCRMQGEAAGQLAKCKVATVAQAFQPVPADPKQTKGGHGPPKLSAGAFLCAFASLREIY
jgi:hypothetical protein